jgi:hypothetical protein
LRGHLTVGEDHGDVGQREIFGRHELLPAERSDRRRRGPSPSDRIMRWPVERVPAQVERDQEAKAGLSPRVAASLISFEKAAEAAATAPDDGTMVAIFDTTRRQLKGAPSASSTSATKMRNGSPSFCWSSAPEPATCKMEVQLQWPEIQSRRIARAGSPMRDQLGGDRKALNGESRIEDIFVEEKYGHALRSSAGAAQMDVFGSPRRQGRAPPQRSPSPSERRSAHSPATRTWRWLGTEATGIF